MKHECVRKVLKAPTITLNLIVASVSVACGSPTFDNTHSSNDNICSWIGFHGPCHSMLDFVCPLHFFHAVDDQLERAELRQLVDQIKWGVVHQIPKHLNNINIMECAFKHM